MHNPSTYMFLHSNLLCLVLLLLLPFDKEVIIFQVIRAFILPLLPMSNPDVDTNDLQTVFEAFQITTPTFQLTNQASNIILSSFFIFYHKKICERKIGRASCRKRGRV